MGDAMDTSIQETPDARAGKGDSCEGPVSRREFLRIGVAAAALLALGGCATFGKSSNLDKAYSNLQKTLDGLTRDEVRKSRLATIARQIENRCRELIQEQQEIQERFDSLSRMLSATSSDLVEAVDGFSVRRTQHRNDLLRLQDELRNELTEKEWALAVQALNETQEAYSPPKMGSD
jgi:hypothetical protein